MNLWPHTADSEAPGSRMSPDRMEAHVFLLRERCTKPASPSRRTWAQSVSLKLAVNPLAGADGDRKCVTSKHFTTRVTCPRARGRARGHRPAWRGSS